MSSRTFGLKLSVERLDPGSSGFVDSCFRTNDDIKKMRNIVFFIDTTNNKEVTVGLRIDGKDFIKKKPLDTRKAQVVLPMLEEMLKERDLQLQDLSAIEVNPGPGSFTGIRVGLSIANALSFLLHIPVNEKIAEEAIY